MRADPYTRHLYAADASMYAVEPLLVAFPRSADDVAAAVAIAGAHGVPVVSRGGGTSLAGQAAGGRGIVLDHSRHLDAIGEIDVAGRRVRVEPGVVQEALNAAAKPHGLGFGPDTSTSNRATLGGMIGNNSSGSASILHGTTIDHVLELEVVLADGSRATFGPVDEAEWARRAQADTLEGAIRRGAARRSLERHARAIAEDYPKHWRQSGGYRLDRFAASGGLDLAQLVTGSEGTLVAITAATVRLIELPRATMFAVGHFDSLAGAIAATQDGLDARRRVDRDDRPHDPRALALQARVPAARGHARGRPRGAAVRLLQRRLRGRDARASSTRSRPPGASTATATTRCAPRRRPTRTR